MIAVANNSVVVINNLTSRRASVIARRTNSEAMGVIKAQMGVVHFVYMKKDGALREACSIKVSHLMKANINRCRLFYNKKTKNSCLKIPRFLQLCA